MKYVNIIIYLFIQAISMVQHGGPLNMPNGSNTHFTDSKSYFIGDSCLHACVAKKVQKILTLKFDQTNESQKLSNRFRCPLFLDSFDFLTWHLILTWLSPKNWKIKQFINIFPDTAGQKKYWVFWLIILLQWQINYL